ncbi:MAG: hypothetical protein NC392_06400 [Roseburia sp.]|nr:hypothetical protein [Roseburia sp.]
MGCTGTSERSERSGGKAREEAWEEARIEAREETRREVRETREKDIGKLLSVLKTFSIPRDAAKQQLMKEYELSEAEADEKLKRYW